ncbi:hypothetical protein DF111_34130 [Burkholderia stagnalis]|nr:hypothetical protein DF148_32450 [Burkholderia stagnalis]RQY48016.1 hypothetical protein DF111_34130 [Burkholderia stagnalis]
MSGREFNQPFQRFRAGYVKPLGQLVQIFHGRIRQNKIPLADLILYLFFTVFFLAPKLLDVIYVALLFVI